MRYAKLAMWNLLWVYIGLCWLTSEIEHNRQMREAAEEAAYELHIEQLQAEQESERRGILQDSAGKQ